MAAPGFAKHPNLWFDDGNVVLIAESTGFRVYRGLLARHSEVFRDMFLLPQSEATAAETYESCPVVRMADDGAEEWERVLGVLHDANGSQHFYSHSMRLPFRTVAAALRLGSKYALHGLRDEALRRLRQCYPVDWQYNHWDNHVFRADYSDLADAQLIATKFDRSPDCSVAFNRYNSIAVLHLARQLGLDELVPAALYRCACDLSIDDLFGAVTNPKDRYCTLTLAELQDCIKAQDDLNIAQSRLYEALSELQTSPACTRQIDGTDELGPCSIAMAIITSRAHCERWINGSSLLDEDIDIPLLEFAYGEGKLCDPCSSYVCTIASQRQDAAWAALRKKFCPSLENQTGSVSDINT